jgi:hypothetical protein
MKVENTCKTIGHQIKKTECREAISLSSEFSYLLTLVVLKFLSPTDILCPWIVVHSRANFSTLIVSRTYLQQRSPKPVAVSDHSLQASYAQMPAEQLSLVTLKYLKLNAVTLPNSTYHPLCTH